MLQGVAERFDGVVGEARRRFLEQEHGRLAHEAAGDDEQLLLAAGERARELLRAVASHGKRA